MCWVYSSLNLLSGDPSTGSKEKDVSTSEGALLSHDVKEITDCNSVVYGWMIKAQLMAAMEAITGALLLALIVGLNIGSVLSVPKPEKLDCDILDGEVTVTWQHPEGAPPNSQYNVQMFKNGGDWEKVQSCTGITDTYCELSSLIHNYRTAYKVKVQLVAGVHESAWTTKKFLPNDSKLRVPTFNVLVTSSSLTVNIVPRPFLKKLFLYGLKYTIFLEERGNRNRVGMHCNFFSNKQYLFG